MELAVVGDVLVLGVDPEPRDVAAYGRRLKQDINVGDSIADPRRRSLAGAVLGTEEVPDAGGEV
eukprot:1407435-Rhodomonas_salina.3